MLTGDNRHTAEAVGRTLDIPPDPCLRGGLASDKASYVKRLQDEGLFTAMVGDGVIFENASPTLSVVTPGTSATAMCTRRRSYGFSGPSCWSIPDCLAFSARNFAILPQLDVLAFAILERVDEDALLVVAAMRPYAMSTTCCSALSGSPR